MSSTKDDLGLWPHHTFRNVGYKPRAPSAQPNLRSTLWKSVSHDCLPQLDSCRNQVGVRSRAAQSVNQSSSGYFSSLYSDPPSGRHFVSKLDERTLQINETTSSSPSGPGRTSCNSSYPASTNLYQCREISTPSPSLHIARERDRAIRFSETNLPYSLTLDSFMDIESINEPLETDYYSPYKSNSIAKPNPSRSSTSSSKALWQSLATNASALGSVFEPRTKRSSLEQSSLPSSPQNKRRAFFNLKLKSVRNHKKSFSLPPGRLASNIEPEPRLLSQPISRIPEKKSPALHKRVSAIFRSGPSNWNRIHSSANAPSLRSRKNQEPSPGITLDPFACPFDSTITPTLQTHLDSPISFASSSIRNIIFRGDDGGIITDSSLVSSIAETSMSTTTSSSLLKNKPLPDIPVDQSYEESESEDKATISSCLGSVIDCFTVLNAQWPEPPRHMMFLDPGMAEMLSYSHHVGNKRVEQDVSPSAKKSPRIALCTQDFKESLKKLLASVEIYLNGSQVSSQLPLPSTLVFPTTTATVLSRPNDTIWQLTIRAPTRSLLMSFCTVYADTTLTFEDQTCPLNQFQIEISIKSAVLPNQPNYEELNIAVQDKNARKKELATCSELEDARILVELPCTLGGLAMVITNASVM